LDPFPSPETHSLPFQYASTEGNYLQRAGNAGGRQLQSGKFSRSCEAAPLAKSNNPSGHDRLDARVWQESLFHYNFHMQYLSLYRRRVDAFPPEAFTAELSAREGQRVKELYAAGLLRQVWKRGDVAGAAIVWEAGGEAEVRAALASLPIFQAGLLEIVAIVPLEPYPGFGPAR
jgi:muconolactone delta-isomerase